MALYLSFKDEGSAAVSSSKGRREPPFLLTMGAPSISLAVKSLAFVAKDLTKEHLAGVPPLLVVPKFWERKLILNESQQKEGQAQKTTLLG